MKSAIVDFVRRFSQAGGTDYVLPVVRIATFDNDAETPTIPAPLRLGRDDSPPFGKAQAR